MAAVYIACAIRNHMILRAADMERLHDIGDKIIVYIYLQGVETLK